MKVGLILLFALVACFQVAASETNKKDGAVSFLAWSAWRDKDGSVRIDLGAPNMEGDGDKKKMGKQTEGVYGNYIKSDIENVTLITDKGTRAVKLKKVELKCKDLGCHTETETCHYEALYDAPKDEEPLMVIHGATDIKFNYAKEWKDFTGIDELLKKQVDIEFRVIRKELKYKWDQNGTGLQLFSINHNIKKGEFKKTGISSDCFQKIKHWDDWILLICKSKKLQYDPREVDILFKSNGEIQYMSSEDWIQDGGQLELGGQLKISEKKYILIKEYSPQYKGGSKRLFEVKDNKLKEIIKPNEGFMYPFTC